MLKKQELYQQAGQQLISLYFQEKDRLREILEAKMRQYIRQPEA